MVGLLAHGVQTVPVQAGAAGAERLNRGHHLRGRGGLAALNCSEEWFEQPISHFSFKPPPGGRDTYQQRYFICLGSAKGPKPPVFFYFGNEDNVELYVEHTGLMWESAPDMGAALVFLEHRYYGHSLPFPPDTPNCMGYLTTEEAMADAAAFLSPMRAGLIKSLGAVGPVVGFGGSYGGMMAAWFRLQYPHLIEGVVSASAPIWSFLDMHPPYDSSAYLRIVTEAASAKGGATDQCKNMFRRVQPLIDSLASSAKGRATLSKRFRTCKPLKTADEARGLLGWVQEPWAYLAMGNFPYASSYLVHGAGLLPAYPVRAACAALDNLPPAPSDTQLLTATREAVAVYYNVTKTVTCYYNNQDGEHDREQEDEQDRYHANDHDWRYPPAAAMRPPYSWHSSPRPRSKKYPKLHLAPSSRPRGRQRERGGCIGDWGYQWCSEMVQPFSSDGVHDMFWPPNPFNLSSASAACYFDWRIRPRSWWPVTQVLGH
jgi:lysosomal Pro-X carboxypeptidase